MIRIFNTSPSGSADKTRKSEAVIKKEKSGALSEKNFPWKTKMSCVTDDLHSEQRAEARGESQRLSQ